jgi:hypothetical protein
MPRKSDPEKYCGFCGKRLERNRYSTGELQSLLHFKRKKYCDRICMAQAFDAKPTKENPGWVTAHYHARKMIEKESCAICGKQNHLDVHHEDGDFRNNAVNNLQVLCRGCHTHEHRKLKVCKVCGGKHKGHGYCEKHLVMWKEGHLPLEYED